MEQAGFIACIDLGTSNIIGLLGRRNEQGVISIIASESIPSESSVKYGIVYNIDEAAGKVKKLLSLLENKIGKKIGKVYVSIAGMSLRVIEHIETKAFLEELVVTFDILNQMEKQARGSNIPLLTNYSVVAPEVFLDSVFQEDPLEKKATTVEVRYRLIAGRPNIKSSLERCITGKDHVDIAGFIVGPIATAAILLEEEDKKAGCALIDFGGGTTTVSVYKSGLLRYMSVIPFGGRTITKDIQSIGLSFDMAESYKIRYGVIGKDKNKSAKKTVSDSLDTKELNKVIQFRQDEIILNVINQINESGYGEELEAGIVITGGASQMKGLQEYLSEKAKLPVKTVSIKRLYINNATELLQNPSYSQCLGLMLFANENCEKVEEVKPIPVHTVEVPNVKPQDTEESEEPKDDNKDKKNKDKDNKNKPKQRSIWEFLGNFGGTLFDEK